MNTLAKELIFYLLIHRNAEGAKYFLSALVETLGDSLQSALLDRSTLHSDHISGRVSDSRVSRALQLMDDGETTLSEVAEKSGLSLRNFNRLFLKETGLNPKDYVILRRMEKAKKLLRETNMTVTDISLEAGYNSLSKFIATFKKYEGILPSDFRASKK